jgi:hypothetical protein
MGRVSSVGITTRYGRSGDPIPVGTRFSALVQTGPESHPDFDTVGTGYFPGGKQPGREADQPPQSSAVVK